MANLPAVMMAQSCYDPEAAVGLLVNLLPRSPYERLTTIDGNEWRKQSSLLRLNSCPHILP